jgi:hypothetical protein
VDLPDTLIHFYRNPDGPFRSITRLGDEQALRVIEEMTADTTWGHERFTEENRRRYLAERRRNERIMYEEFLARGGRPVLRNPLYLMFLTPGLRERHAGSRSVVVPLSRFREDIVSCTYLDSGATYGIPRDPDGPPPFLPPSILPRLGRLYRLEEFRALVARVGPPERFYMEAQVWDDAPLGELLGA